jgi:hypothetical protein
MLNPYKTDFSAKDIYRILCECINNKNSNNNVIVDSGDRFRKEFVEMEMFESFSAIDMVLKLCYGEQEKYWEQMLERVVDYVKDFYERTIRIEIKSTLQDNCNVILYIGGNPSYFLDPYDTMYFYKNIRVNEDLCKDIPYAMTVRKFDQPIYLNKEKNNIV